MSEHFNDAEIQAFLSNDVSGWPVERIQVLAQAVESLRYVAEHSGMANRSGPLWSPSVAQVNLYLECRSMIEAFVHAAQRCCLCDTLFVGYGNNPAPLSQKKKDRCCDACQNTVLQARINRAGCHLLHSPLLLACELSPQARHNAK